MMNIIVKDVALKLPIFPPFLISDAQLKVYKYGQNN